MNQAACAWTRLESLLDVVGQMPCSWEGIDPCGWGQVCGCC